MKRVLTTVFLFATLVLLLAGCNNLFTYNAFDGMGAPEAPASADAVAEIVETGGVDALLSSLDVLSESDTFYEDLIEQDVAAGPEGVSALDQILDELGTVYTDASGAPIVVDSETPPETISQIRQAALLAADIELNTSEGSVVVDSLVSVAFGFLDESGDGEDTAASQDTSFESVVSDVINTAFGSLSEDQFVEALSSLQNSAVAFEAFGNTLETVEDPESGEVTAVESPAGVNMEAVTQNAVVAIAMAEVVTAYEEQNPGETITTKDQLIAIATGASDSGSTDHDANAAIISGAVTSLQENDSFNNILTASGLGDLLDIGGTSE